MKQDSHATKQNNYKVGDLESVFATTTNCPSTNSCKGSFLRYVRRYCGRLIDICDFILFKETKE